MGTWVPVIERATPLRASLFERSSTLASANSRALQRKGKITAARARRMADRARKEATR